MANAPAAGRPRSSAAQRLVAAFTESGCPVCRCLEADARRDLAAFLREQTMDPEGRAALRKAGGFCGWHTGLLPGATDGILSVALIAEGLLGPGAPGRVACPACATLRHRAEEYLRMLLEPVVLAGAARGPGLPCRPHLRGLRSLVRDPARVTALDRAIAPQLARLRGALARFIAKQDYRSAEPPTAEEAEAWREALEHVAGRPGLFGSDLARG